MSWLPSVQPMILVQPKPHSQNSSKPLIAFKCNINFLVLINIGRPALYFLNYFSNVLSLLCPRESSISVIVWLNCGLMFHAKILYVKYFILGFYLFASGGLVMTKSRRTLLAPKRLTNIFNFPEIKISGITLIVNSSTLGSHYSAKGSTRKQVQPCILV